MSSVTSLHSLFQIEWTLKDIKLFLKNDSSSVNEVNSGYTPLLWALRYNYPIEIIKLLLHYGANVNCRDRHGYTPLQFALMYRRNGNYIKLLLKKGADITISEQFHCNLFCFALKFYYSINIIRRLLDAGCLQSVCSRHDSVLHCVVCHDSNSKPTWDPFVFRNILQLLVERRVNVNAINTLGESVMCLALRKGINASDIEALLAAGSVLNCKLHTNPLICFTSWGGTQLKTEVVQVLLDRGACVNFEVMKCALRHFVFDDNIFKLLVEHLQSGDIEAVAEESNDTLLHLASLRSSRHSVLKLLIKRGVPVNSVNKQGNTALHEAAACYRSSSGVEALLESGSNVKVLNASHDAPLHLAMVFPSDPNTFKLLFAYGAQIGENRYSLLKSALDKYSGRQQNVYLNCCTELVKGYLLEFGCHGFQDLIQGNRQNYKALLKVGSNCIREYKKMSSEIVAEDRTLKEFLKGKALFQKDNGIIFKRAFFNQLLRVLAKNDFPMFFNNISAKVGRSQLEIELQDLLLFAMRYCEGSSTIETIALNKDTLYNIATFLTNEDLLRFICASYKTIDHFCTGESSKAKTHENKRRSEQLELCRKHPKLHL